jgi:hypothetical protein
VTKRQRAQVVELLRCGADIVNEAVIPLTCAQRYLGLNEEDLFDADRARVQVSREGITVPFMDGEIYRYWLLEAAQRVEEGSWP